MAAQGWLPEIFVNVASRIQTPSFATVVIVLAVAVFATWLPLVGLVQITSFLALVVLASNAESKLRNVDSERHFGCPLSDCTSAAHSRSIKEVIFSL